MISDKDKRYLELAKRQAMKSLFMPKRVGIVIAKGNKILAEGFNRVSHPMYLRFNSIDEYAYYSLHAECDALARTDKKLKGAIAYLWAVKVKSNHAKPCELCQRYLASRGVKRVIFTTEKGLIEEMSL